MQSVSYANVSLWNVLNKTEDATAHTVMNLLLLTLFLTLSAFPHERKLVHKFGEQGVEQLLRGWNSMEQFSNVFEYLLTSSNNLTPKILSIFAER